MPKHGRTHNPASAAQAAEADQQPTTTTPEGSPHISTSKSSSRTEATATDTFGPTPTPTIEEGPEAASDETVELTIRRRSRRPGYTQRHHRELLEKARIRHDEREKDPSLTPEELEDLVNEKYLALLPNDPAERAFYDALAPVSVCPDRRDLHSLVEVKAVRSLPFMQDLEDRLRGCKHGRPSDRRLVVAAFERNILENGRPEINSHYKDFKLANEPLHWAYDWPARQGSTREHSSVYKTLHSALLRCDPEICLDLNVQAIVELRRRLGDPEIGRHLLFDGTSIPAPREQARVEKGRDEEEQLLRRGLDGATFSYHGGRKVWRGYGLVYLTDVKTGLALGFALIPGNRPEYEVLADLLTKIHELWEKHAGEPWEPEHLVGDALFDNEGVHRVCEERFGIHPVFPRSGELSGKYSWADNDGVPYCAKHGDMKLLQADDFVDSKARTKKGIKPGEKVDLRKALIRWVCVDPTCPVETRTHWNKNPRAYTYLPPKGVHKKRVPLRQALLRRRNAVESLNARLKGRGIGNGGMNVARWIKTDQEMAWLCYATTLGFTLLRFAHETGAYDVARDEADLRDLLRPCQPSPTPAASKAAPGTAAP